MSSPKISRVKQLGYLVEAPTAYGVNQSGSIAYNTLRFSEATMATNLEELPNMTAVQYIHTQRKNVVGRKRVQVSVKSHLFGAGTALSKDQAPGTHDISDVLGVVLGGQIKSSGSQNSTLPTSSGTVRFANRTNFDAGGLVGCVNPSTNRLEVRKLQSITSQTGLGGTGSLHAAFSFIPASGSEIYNGYLSYLAMESTSSLQMYVKGANPYDTWVAVGMNGGFSLENVLGQLPNISFDLNGASWFSGAVAAAAANVPISNYGTSIPPVFKDSTVLFYKSGSFPVYGTNVCEMGGLRGLTVTPSVNYIDQLCAGGVENIQAKVLGPSTIGGQLQMYFSSTNYFNDRDDATEYGMLVQIGSTPGRTVVFSIPRVQITDVQRDDAEGLVGQTISWMALNDEWTVIGNSTDLAYSPIQVGFF